MVPVSLRSFADSWDFSLASRRNCLGSCPSPSLDEAGAPSFGGCGNGYARGLSLLDDERSVRRAGTVNQKGKGLEFNADLDANWLVVLVGAGEKVTSCMLQRLRKGRIKKKKKRAWRTRSILSQGESRENLAHGAYAES